MTTQARRRLLVGGCVLYALGLGVVTGIAVERIRFSQARSEVLSRYDEATRSLRTRLMAVELSTLDRAAAEPR